MPLYYLEESREPRECPTLWARVGSPKHPKRCQCKGTGRLGVEGAEPDVEITHPEGAKGYWWRLPSTNLSYLRGYYGPHSTPEAALAAAREAARR